VSAEVDNAACPFASVWVPSGFVPSRKVTVPVGVPVAGAAGDTAAVKVTDWPMAVGLAEEDNTTDAPLRLAELTTSAIAAEVAAAKFASPE
jgi:hypothetical protein